MLNHITDQFNYMMFHCIDSLVCQTLAHKETKQNRAEFKCTERKGGPSTAGAPCTPAKPWAQCTQ